MSPAEEEETVAAIRLAGGPTPTFFSLMLLSTVIASYGLLSNSTATVIGAMIVAPLMGPILGAALAVVQGDVGEFRRSLLAGVLGVLVCIVTAASVTLLAGVENVDFGQSEILGRTRPTLYDLAIGLAAGLAGAFATVNRSIGGSIAGVAIAVALVPPLSVTGMSLAGASQDPTLLRAAVGSFMLFMANYLTIELAAVLIFLVAGLGHLERILRSRSLLDGLGLQLLVLSFTLYFLGAQLHQIVTERHWAAECRQLLDQELAGIPGATLAELRVQSQARSLRVDALVRSPQEITPAQVAHMRQKLADHLDLQVSLVVSTAVSIYYSDRGQLYVPQRQDDPRQRALRLIEEALKLSLQTFPSVELVSFRQQEAGELRRRFLVTVRSPYEFDTPLVNQLQEAVNEEYRLLAKEDITLELTVRTVISRDYDARGPVESEQVLTPEQKFRRDLRGRLDEELQALVAEIPGALLIRSDFVFRASQEAPDGEAGGPFPTPLCPSPEPREAEAGVLEVRAVVRTATPLRPSRVARWQTQLAIRLRQRVTLLVDNRLGQSVTGDSPSPASGPAQP